MDYESVLEIILKAVTEKAREDKEQSSDPHEEVVHVSKLSRGCARFEERRSYEEDLKKFVHDLIQGNENSASWLLGQLIHIALESLNDGKTVNGCKITSEKEIEEEVEIPCPPYKVRVVGHVDMFVECPDKKFAVELKYRSTGELGLRSLYQTKVYSAALKVPVYIVMVTPERVRVERIEADYEFLKDVVTQFKCEGIVRDIIYNPDARPCNNCVHRGECDLLKSVAKLLINKSF